MNGAGVVVRHGNGCMTSISSHAQKLVAAFRQLTTEDTEASLSALILTLVS